MTPLKLSTITDERMSLSSQLLTPLMDFGEPEEKRIRRKPNFTVQERMHLAQSYVESYEEYNRGFTATTKGEAKIGRQRLLERWAAELSSFGIVERTPVEIEQKIRDYMKKIAANRKRAVKRAMSPSCQLISSVVSESSTVDDSTIDDSLTAYAGFLLEQHRVIQNDCTENFEPLRLVNSNYDVEEIKSMTNDASILCFESTDNIRNICHKRKTSDTNSLPNEKESSVKMLETNIEVVPLSSEMHRQQMDFGSIDLALKAVYVEIAKKELEKKTLEVETIKVNLEIKRLELEGKRHDVEKKRFELRKMQKNVVEDSLTISSSESNGTPQDTSLIDKFDLEAE
ncbi:Xanthine phosphoribosyltransferase [Dirofilaria immitis]